jgi:hypothetical protein
MKTKPYRMQSKKSTMMKVEDEKLLYNEKVLQQQCISSLLQ